MYDVAIIGGGPAGLSAAIVLGRACRRVVVIDSNRPRNYAAKIVNNYLGVVDASPAQLRAIGRKQVVSFGGELRDVEAVEARQLGEVFSVKLADSTIVEARKILLATGMRDVLPELSG